MIADGAALVCPVMADDAGALLVRSGLVSTSALEAARAGMTAAGGTLGEHLVQTGAIADDTLTEFYRERLLVPKVNPNNLARLAANVIATIPADLAVELRAIPVSLDQDNNLTVAMSDPSDRHAVDEIAFFTGAYVVRAVATQMQIAWCLAHYYSHITALGSRLMQPAPAEVVTAATSGSLPRVKGLTGEINAQRRHALVPVESSAPEPLAAAPSKAIGTESSDGVPVPAPGARRADSISGELRVAHPRAQSIKPELDPRDVLEESGPVITVEVGAELAEAARALPRRARKAKTDPPELAARAGEVSIATQPVHPVDLDEPRIVISMEPEPRADGDGDGGVVIHETMRPEPVSEPVLLIKTAPATIHDVPPEDDDEVVELTALKKSRRRDKRTEVGIGAVTATTARSSRDTETDLAVSAPDLELAAAPIAPLADAVTEPASAPIATAGDVRTGTSTRAKSISEQLDDGWGDVGDEGEAATPLVEVPILAPMPGYQPSGQIPILPVERPSQVALDMRALEAAMHRSLELLRALEQAPDRDSVTSLMIDHLAATHQRAGFLALRTTTVDGAKVIELGLFAMKPPPTTTKFATLALDRPSTLQDVVGTRLPYRGPVTDDPSRAFLGALLGTAPDEILLVPVTIRERVVGVLFGDHREEQTFDDQLALAARAAGLALERILKAKR